VPQRRGFFLGRTCWRQRLSFSETYLATAGFALATNDGVTAMPILMWLMGVPLVLIVAFMLLR